MAFYLWMRFDASKEEWPKWDQGVEWQSIKLLKGRSQSEKLTYDAQLKYVRRTFEDRGIFMKAWTHAGRHAGLLHGEALSIPDAELRRLGHWDFSRMAKHYSSGVSREAAREMAGHRKGEGAYYLSRECLVPPMELQKLVFPRLEESLNYINSFEPKDRDRAAQAFLLTLQWLRIVLIQDAIILSDMFPKSPLWQIYPFRSPLFLDFKQLALQAIEEDEHPNNVHLQKMIPVVADRLLVMSQVIGDGFRNVERVVQTNQETSHLLLNNINTLLSKTHETERQLSLLNRGAQGFVDAYNSALPQALPPPSMDSFDPQAEPQPQICDGHTQKATPLYIPNPNIQSVEHVWEEWYDGLADDSDGKRGPAIKELEGRHKAAWRRPGYVTKRFQRRRSIVRRLDIVAERLGISSREAARRVELWKSEMKMSLDKLQKEIDGNQELWGPRDIDLS
jgi:Centromere DNA-binding protein complex CBF3 subunit, domain 2/Transcriptional activator of glycolytic enzymes